MLVARARKEDVCLDMVSAFRCVLLDGSCNGVRYTARSGGEQLPCRLDPGDSWGELSLPPSDTSRCSHITLLAGNTGASYAFVRTHDYDSLTRVQLDWPPNVVRPAPTLVRLHLVV